MMRPTVIEKGKGYEVGECPLCGWSPFKDEKSGIRRKKCPDCCNDPKCCKGHTK